MVSRASVIQHLNGLEDVRRAKDDISLFTVSWDGTDRQQDVTVEVGSEKTFAMYSPFAQGDEVGIDKIKSVLSDAVLPSGFELCLYEFFPPEFYWCIGLTADYAEIESIEVFRSTAVLLANVADVLESRISGGDVL